MTNKKYCRPRMTVEARDAINKACEKLAEACKESSERSDLIINACSEMSLSDSYKKLLESERQSCRWWADGFRAEWKSHAKTKKIMLISIMINLCLIAYMVFS